MTDRLDLEPATIPIRYAREALARLGLPPAERARLLREADIASGLLRGSSGRLTGAQFARLHRRAVAASGDESLGYAAQRTPVGSFAFLVSTLTRCADLGACLEQASAFYRLFDPRGGWEVEAGPATTTIRLRLRDRAQAGSVLYVHSMLLTPSRTAAWLVGRSLPLDAVVLPERFRPFAEETRFLFGTAPSFGGEAATRFATRQLALPVIRGPADATAYLQDSLRGFLLGAAGDEVEHRVRGVLAESTPFASASVDQVARRVAMSRQTLARHLQRAGTSFATLRDELRRDFAIGLLTRGLRVAEVSERLGYSEPSAFHRAFRTWTGSAPGRYAGSRRVR